MIKSFKDKRAERIFYGEDIPKGIARDLQYAARKKLLMLHRVAHIEDLEIPPGNRLEKLSGDRKNQYSIRVNQQWRICFRFIEGDAHEVELIDYH